MLSGIIDHSETKSTSSNFSYLMFIFQALALDTKQYFLFIQFAFISVLKNVVNKSLAVFFLVLTLNILPLAAFI